MTLLVKLHPTCSFNWWNSNTNSGTYDLYFSTRFKYSDFLNDESNQEAF